MKNETKENIRVWVCLILALVLAHYVTGAEWTIRWESLKEVAYWVLFAVLFMFISYVIYHPRDA